MHINPILFVTMTESQMLEKHSLRSTKAEDAGQLTSGDSPSVPLPISAYEKHEVRKTVRKLDAYLLSLCFILYTFSVLDRSNLGNARTAGLEDDVDLSGNRYPLLGTV